MIREKIVSYNNIICFIEWIYYIIMDVRARSRVELFKSVLGLIQILNSSPRIPYNTQYDRLTFTDFKIHVYRRWPRYDSL